MTKLTEQIQRYNVVHMPPKGERTMQPFEHGMWVRTTDHLEALARLSEQQEWPTDAECRADAPGGPLAQRTPATAPAPQGRMCGHQVYVGTTGESSCELPVGHAGKHRQGQFEWYNETVTEQPASAPQSTERMHGAAEIERAMRDTPELGNPARNYKDVDRLIKRVLARLSDKGQPSKKEAK
jgi:hypothetical protein